MGTVTALSFSALYRTHARAVYRFALYLSGNATLAEDIVSETFLRVWDSAVPIRTETVRGYLFAIARNVFLHEVRRKRALPLSGAEHTVVAHSGAEHGDELRDTLAELQRLPEADRAALLLQAEEGFTYEEIARILGRSVPAIKVKIHRARLKLIEWRKGEVHGNH